MTLTVRTKWVIGFGAIELNTAIKLTIGRGSTFDEVVKRNLKALLAIVRKVFDRRETNRYQRKNNLSVGSKFAPVPRYLDGLYLRCDEGIAAFKSA